MKHISWRTMGHLAGLVSQRLVRGQFNFLKMLWRFNKVYNLERLLDKVQKRQKPVLDKATAQFVEETR